MAQSKRSEQVRKYDKDTAVCVKDVSEMCQRCVKDVSRMCQGCVRDVSEMCQGCVKDVSSLTIFPPLEGKTLKVNDAKPNVSQMSVKCQSSASNLVQNNPISSPIVPLLSFQALPSASVAIPTTRIISIAVSRHHHGVPVRAARSAAAWW
jgi:hypothetical protein